MGLDITAYEALRPVGPRTPQWDYDEGTVAFWRHPGFPGRADDIDDGLIYSHGDEFGFRAGSYGGYNSWREQLAEFAGYPTASDSYRGRPTHSAGAWERDSGPFWELINFADNEGVIGTAVSTKLASDFAEHQARADAHPDEWFRTKYTDWRKAFEMASRGGAVAFH